PHPEPPPPSIPAQAPIAAAIAPTLAKLPLAIVQNAGQTDPSVKFHTRGLGGSLFFTSNELIMRLPSSPGTRDNDTPGRSRKAETPPILVRHRLLGTNPNALVTSMDRLPGVTNVLIGSDASKWRSNLPTYAGLVYQNIYAGIDLRYDGTGALVKSTYQVAPGADPNRIRWRYTGAFDTQIDSKGNLLVRLPAPGVAISTTATVSGTLIEEAPQAWQEIGGRRIVVDARYTIAANGSIGFTLGTYDSRQPLTIDPTFNYSTYLGGNGDESGYGIAVDGMGQIYVTGSTNSTGFPTQNALFPGCGLNAGICSGDAFVTKFTANGQQLIYSTFFGGDSADVGWAIAVDSGGNAYVTGQTYSNNFPTTLATAKQPTYGGGGNDVFVSKLNADGSQLLYSTYLGGVNDDYGYGIAVDNSGKAYVTGAAVSAGATSGTGFPLTTSTAPRKSQPSYGMMVACIRCVFSGGCTCLALLPNRSA
ncbi:MAG: SBBP repeat-containing protein, partial [Chloroflexota bacterium]|nr:SBBP repeat-containing protein [Chloroflexota bacterium]